MSINEWIPVEERLPEPNNLFNNSEIVIIFVDGDWMEGFYDYGDNCWRGNYWDEDYGKKVAGIVTHWMPGPKQPEDKCAP